MGKSKKAEVRFHFERLLKNNQNGIMVLTFLASIFEVRKTLYHLFSALPNFNV